jgi:peroxiredoxin
VLLLLGVCFVLGIRDVVDHRETLGPLSPGDPAPAFRLQSPVNALEVSLEELRGRVVLLDFWATWCPPCLRELPELAALHREFKDQGFSVVAINREPENPAGVREFVTKQGLPFPVVGAHVGVGERYRILSLPLSVLVDRKGTVLRVFMGYTPPQVMRAEVLSALGLPRVAQ